MSLQTRKNGIHLTGKERVAIKRLSQKGLPSRANSAFCQLRSFIYLRRPPRRLTMSDATLTLTLTQREAEALTKMGRHFTLDDARKLAASHPEANDIHSACDQFVHSKIGTPRTLAAWLSGFYNSQRNSPIVDTQNFEENLRKLENFCRRQENSKLPVMQAIERVTGK
jgi:hypothetical protein